MAMPLILGAESAKKTELMDYSTPDVKSVGIVEDS